jgi:hypothetical protein
MKQNVVRSVSSNLLINKKMAAYSSNSGTMKRAHSNCHLENLKERDHMGDLDLDGRIILKCLDEI